MKSSVAQFIVRFLKECGVRHLFGVSGHSIFDITDALYGDPEIRFVQAVARRPGRLHGGGLRQGQEKPRGLPGLFRRGSDQSSDRDGLRP
jgi:hypothetical protein